MQKINCKKAPQAIGPYSQGVIVGSTIYLSGQIPLDPVSGAVVGSDIATQTTQVLSNIAALLEEAGTGFDSVVKTTCYLANMDDFKTFNELYGKTFVSKPARACVAVKTLPQNVLVEIEVIASLAN